MWPLSGILAHVSPRSSLVGMSEGSPSFDAEITDHQVIFRAGQVEAVVVPLEEYRALKALEQREAELYWSLTRAGIRPGPVMTFLTATSTTRWKRWWPISALANEILFARLVS